MSEGWLIFTIIAGVFVGFGGPCLAIIYFADPYRKQPKRDPSERSTP